MPDEAEVKRVAKNKRIKEINNLLFDSKFEMIFINLSRYQLN